MKKLTDRRFVCFLHTVPWNISLGVTVDIRNPNIEIHLPWCFIRVGWQGVSFPPYNNRTYGKSRCCTNKENLTL